MSDVTAATPDLVTPFYQYLLAVHIATEEATRAQDAADEMLPANIESLGLVSRSHAGVAQKVLADYLRNVYERAFNASMDDTLYNFEIMSAPGEVSVYDLIDQCGDAGKELQADHYNSIVSSYEYHLRLIVLVAERLQLDQKTPSTTGG